MALNNKFRFSIDRGGTFTDIYAEVPGDPGYRIVKLLSEDPANYVDAPREGIRRILSEFSDRPLSPDDIDASSIDWIRMGTTIATNALLERQGARCALMITKGFRNLLHIGTQNRPHIFDLEIKKPEVLYEEVLEVDERVRVIHPDSRPPTDTTDKGISGESIEVLKAPSANDIRAALQVLRQKGIDSLAVVFMNAYTFPDHEMLVGKIAADLGFRQISLSSQIMPMIKIVTRGDTTVVDSYLSPHIRDYIDNFRAGFKDNLSSVNLQFMRSDGGLTPASSFNGSRAIFSGPAGGVVGCAQTAFTDEQRPVIGFDMGGTSTDVSRFDGNYELVHETETAGTRIQAPQLDIITVASGGGSRLFFRHNMFEVGPESAGAHPGPVCYRKDGHLTVTDANLLLGRLQPDFFPNIFGPDTNQPLDLNGSRTAFEKLRATINRAENSNLSLEEIAFGFIRVANQAMIRPMREISVARGYDIKEHVLACFGGAGAQHACAIAADLGISRIHIHRFSGILSAYGLGMADVAEERNVPATGQLIAENMPGFEERLTSLADDAQAGLVKQGFTEQQIRIEYFLNLRYQGTDTSLMIPLPPDGDYRAAFLARYRREFGFVLEGRDILVDDLRVRASGKTSHLHRFEIGSQQSPPTAVTTKPCYFSGGWQDTPVFILADLGTGAVIDGPALIIHETSTILVEPGCQATVNIHGDLLIVVPPGSERSRSGVDPVQLAIFSNLFMSIAEQMGRTLQRTAISTNIKERCDFSCAIFDQHGGLVANAPHQPVHLGAMSEAVKRQIALLGDNLKEGEVLVSNHPGTGGSHLPDITVITPVFRNNRPVFFVANRGHHADIGGITPGSMPPFSRYLSEEGACIKSFKLVENHVFQEEGIRALLTNGATTPDGRKVAGARAIEDNISDLKAQVAANHQGVQLLTEMADKHTLATVQAYMQYIQDNAEKAVRAMLRGLAAAGSQKMSAEDFLDDGSPICLKITINPQSGDTVFDFTGTGPQVTGNWNAPRAVTSSAVIYVLRCLVAQDIPLNQGCLNPVQIIVPEGSLLAPSEEAAVVGGNVLTSQRVVDVILKAFGAAAASQGCMNNLTFGSNRFGYYETIGGGAGAGPNWHGQSGVHTHMTNTRITDPEILEKRYPVLLREFSLRKESGGRGRYQGGEGIIREMEFLADLQAAILSERRIYPPYGLAGGEDAAPGKNILFRKNGESLDLGGKNEVSVQDGDRLRIMTPGGGGYGPPGD